MKIVLHTEQNPEDNAMLQALYSRSAESVTDHLEKLKEVGSGKFMSQYYLGYGHNSIADCGFITVYIEGLSMLAAKAIQDNPLYNGQESSSRYIDWSNQEFFDPYGYDPYSTDNHPAGFAGYRLLKELRRFYVDNKPRVIKHLKQQYPLKEGEKETVYEKAITAKAFDILRGFLPCGATTNVAWTTSLRKANEHLNYLSLHPLKEIREVASEIHKILIEAYPNSIAALPVYEELDPYFKDPVNFYSTGFELNSTDFKVVSERQLKESYLLIPNQNQNLYLPEMYEARPRRALLPKHDVSLYRQSEYYFKLDFGSYRDLQRHRGGYCSVPAIDNADGFHGWYYDQLPEESQKEADKLFEILESFVGKALDSIIADEDCTSEEAYIRKLTEIKLKNQYFLPMGTLVNLALLYSYHQALYVAQLRSGQTVHATLRPVAQWMGNCLEAQGIRTDCDFSDDAWTLRRGSQDIVKKVV